jgi:hypothetical protein
MLPEPISSAFLLEKTSLTMAELEWAFSNGLIGAQTVVDVAGAALVEGVRCEMLVQLAGLTQSELTEVKDLLAGCAGEDTEQLRAKWVWLVLSWVWEKHATDSELFEIVDSLYADFSYPAEMEPFGPYAPAYQGKTAQEAREEARQELRKYLTQGESKFGKA